MFRTHLQERLDFLNSDLGQRLNVNKLTPLGTGSSIIIPKSNRWLKSEENEKLIANLESSEKLKLAMKILEFKNTNILRINETIPEPEPPTIPTEYVIPSVANRVYYLIVNGTIGKSVLKHLPRYQLFDLSEDRDFGRLSSMVLQNRQRVHYVNNLDAVDLSAKKIKLVNPQLSEFSKLTRFTQLEHLEISNTNYKLNGEVAKVINELSTLKSLSHKKLCDNISFNIPTLEEYKSTDSGIGISFNECDLNLKSVHAFRIMPDEFNKVKHLRELSITQRMDESTFNEILELTLLEDLSILIPYEATFLTKIGKLDKLKRLKLGGGSLSKEVCGKVSLLVNLEKLKLMGVSEVYFELLKVIPLKCLNIHHIGVTEDNAKHIAQMNTVTKLIARNCGIGDKELHHIVKMSNLEHLDVSGNGVTQVPFEVVDLPNLRYLDVSDNNVNHKFVRYCQQIPSLRFLIVNNNYNVSAKGISKIPNLFDFQMTNGNFNDAELDELCSHPKLKRLKIKGCRLPEGYIHRVCNLTGLTHLSVDYPKSGITTDYFGRLLKLTKLEVLDIPGRHLPSEAVTRLIKMSNLRCLMSDYMENGQVARLRKAPKLEYATVFEKYHY